MSDYNKNAIIIQKCIKKYLIMKNILIPDSCYQTKVWRMNRNWYKGGKHNECEKYQLKMIEKIISNRVEKTYFRINIETNELTEIAYPLKKIDGFEWTENFDGRLLINKNTYLFNLKFVCDRGGSN